ncbi:zinc ribbon domain-containing protein [uncultured Methylobacterium sp.]|uniref:zinc ribbon domain-containing protein n=1 Tax=uncultured Methylobacterium sp. TaxID=157278 RepID=UPI00338E9EC8
MVAYTLRALGGALVTERAAYSSRTCRICGHCEPGNRESQAVFRCLACGDAENADMNTAGVLLGGVGP